MDEAQYIDWYDVVEAVVNGRTEGHSCPACGHGELHSSVEGSRVRLVCPACGQGFDGTLAHGRDDGLYAEADAMLRRQAQRRQAAARPASAVDGPLGGVCAPGVDTLTTRADEAPPAPAAPRIRRPEPWQWTLPANSTDVEMLAVWREVIESIHNGRQVGLRCPFCSEPLSDITHQPPYMRVRCGMCGEAFEGRLG